MKTMARWHEVPTPDGRVAALLAFEPWILRLRGMGEVEEALRSRGQRSALFRKHHTFSLSPAVLPGVLDVLPAALRATIRVERPEWFDWIERERILHRQRQTRLMELAETAGDAEPRQLSLFRQKMLQTLHERAPTVLDRLYGYQRGGLLWVNWACGRAILNDDMGLGKTPQALAYLETSRVAHKALIVCPTSVALNWQEEAARWAPAWRVHVPRSTRQLRDRLIPALQGRQQEALVVTWGMLRLCRDALVDADFDTVIVDEAHYAKEPSAQRSVVLVELVHKAQQRLLLTGTQIKSRPKETWPLLHLVDPLSWPLFSDYGERYCGARNQRTKSGHVMRIYQGASRLPELNAKLRGWALRREKTQVLTQLPPRRRQRLDVGTASAGLRREWIALQKRLKQRHQGDDDGSALGALQAMRQKVGLEKVESAIEWLLNTVDGGEQVVCFLYHTEVHDRIAAGLRKHGVRVGSIIGSTSRTRRQTVKETFQAGDLDVVLGSEAMKEGVTLTAACNSLHVERWWVPGDESQATDRIFRVGQTRGVLNVFLHLRESLDDHVAAVLDGKEEVISAVNDRTPIHAALLRRLLGA